MRKCSFLFIAIFVLAIGCDEEKIDKSSCSNAVVAEVKDLRGLDGCSFVFELEDGTRLEPVGSFYCGTPPLPKEVTEDPLYNFEWVDGKKVKITYKLVTDVATVCMAGQTVKITCLEEFTFEEE